MKQVLELPYYDNNETNNNTSYIVSDSIITPTTTTTTTTIDNTKRVGVKKSDIMGHIDYSHMINQIKDPNELGKCVCDLTDIDQVDFTTRFTFIKLCKNSSKDVDFNTVTLKSKNSYITRNNVYAKLGRYSDMKTKCYDKDGTVNHPHRFKVLYNNDDKVIAKEIGYIQTYHYYNTNCMFAGTIGEIIVQLPLTLRHSDRLYYYTFDSDNIGFSSNGGEYHLIKVTFFEDVCVVVSK